MRSLAGSSSPATTPATTGVAVLTASLQTAPTAFARRHPCRLLPPSPPMNLSLCRLPMVRSPWSCQHFEQESPPRPRARLIRAIGVPRHEAPPQTRVHCPEPDWHLSMAVRVSKHGTLNSDLDHRVQVQVAHGRKVRAREAGEGWRGLARAVMGLIWTRGQQRKPHCVALNPTLLLTLLSARTTSGFTNLALTPPSSSP